MTNTTLLDEEARVERLDFLIDQYYGTRDPELIEYLARDYEYETMAMIEVRHVLADAIVAEDFNDDVYAPVVVPPDLRLCLAPGDVFLATLALKEGAWHVLYLSPRYDAIDGEFEDDEEAGDENHTH